MKGETSAIVSAKEIVAIWGRGGVELVEGRVELPAARNSAMVKRGRVGGDGGLGGGAIC
jgi:hypothetical protein